MAELAVLLTAGLTPDRAWEEVAARRGPESIPARIWHLRLRGESLSEAIRQATSDQSVAWRSCGASWVIARASGAPLGPALASIATSVRAMEALTRQVEAELAAPRSTMRLVGFLPLLAPLAGALGGVNTLTFFVSTSVGLFSLIGGGLCLGLAWWWMRLMVHRVLEARTPPSPRTDLFLVALGGGESPHQALVEVDRVMADWQLEVPVVDELEGLIELSVRAGVPLGSLARAHLDSAREKESAEASRAVGALSVHLVLPLGLLVLPAFVLMAVVPLAWGIGQQATL